VLTRRSTSIFPPLFTTLLRNFYVTFMTRLAPSIRLLSVKAAASEASGCLWLVSVKRSCMMPEALGRSHPLSVRAAPIAWLLVTLGRGMGTVG
jgi:hypothetical protein